MAISNSQVSSHIVFGTVFTNQVFAHTLNVFPGNHLRVLALLQSRIHEDWARFFGSSLEERLRYTPSDCFETFPFPERWETDFGLEEVGREYHEFRAALMVRHNEGLTKTYNRFHDPEHDGSGVDGVDPESVRSDIAHLRRLHNDLDRAVLSAYGWTDLDPACEFLLDYEEDESETPQKGKGRKKPWRLRFPDPIRDEILARLLALNARYAEEDGIKVSAKVARNLLAGRSAGGSKVAPAKSASAATASPTAPKARKAKPGNEAQGSLL